MTREEAVRWLINMKSEYEGDDWEKLVLEAFDMAVAAMREPISAEEKRGM